ncbi:MAG TPA: T9SS type A sorting domain-containing protein [Edaphocola sp.]|nr:T9SS type A sorting domain-containing protein [Edaphocola sp.]
MKNKTLLTILLLSISFTAFSTVFTVNNSGNSFSPANTTVILGDTINFDIANMHNVIEVSQTTWAANNNTPLSGGFSTPFGGGMVYTATLTVGTHYFVCSPHSSSGMKGMIIVQACTLPTTPTAISGDSAVCGSSTNTYTVNPVSGATDYTWTLPNGWSGTSTTNSITVTTNNTGGDLIVSANNSCGASGNKTLSITVNAVDTSVSKLNDSTLSANANGANYQWMNCSNNEIITGETNQVFQASINGDYAVIVTENGCIDTSSCHNIILTSTRINELSNSENIFIFPNPSNGHFQIIGSALQLNKNYKIEIYNIIGKKIYQSVIFGTNSDIDISKQAKGIYLLTINDGLNIYTNKIILK